MGNSPSSDKQQPIKFNHSCALLQMDTPLCGTVFNPPYLDLEYRQAQWHFLKKQKKNSAVAGQLEVILAVDQQSILVQMDTWFHIL